MSMISLPFLAELFSFGEVIVKHYLNYTACVQTIYINININSLSIIILFFHHKTYIIQMPRGRAKT